jgi:hypothetical protein
VNHHVHIEILFESFILYRAIKLICNRIIRESEIVCRFLNNKQLKTQVRFGHINRKDIRIQIHG